MKARAMAGLALCAGAVLGACSRGDSSEQKLGTVSQALDGGIIIPQSSWFPIGPQPIGPMLVGLETSSQSYTVDTNSAFGATGRASAVAPNTANPFQAFVGTAAGGLWFYTDTVRNAPELIFDDVPAIGVVAVEPSTCGNQRCTDLWVGTGEGGVRRQTFSGDGLYKIHFNPGSGEIPQPRWDATRVAGSDTITPSAIDSLALTGTAAARTVFFTVTAANTSSPRAATVFEKPPPAGYGVFRFDAVANVMEREQVPPNDSATANLPGDLVQLQNSEGTVLLAGFYNRGIYRKVLGSSTPWCPMNPGAPAVSGCAAALSGCAAGATLPNPSSQRFDHITLAVAPQDGNIVYAGFADCSDRWSANGGGTLDFDCGARIFRSTDGGKCWFDMNTAVSTLKGDTELKTYSNYTTAIAVSPHSTSRLYYGGTLAYVSEDGGATFKIVFPGKLHPDHHDFAFSSNRFTLTPEGNLNIDPNGALELFYGTNDGGFAWGLRGGSTEVIVTNTLQPHTVQLYGLGVAPRQPCTARSGIDDDCNGLVDDGDECSAPNSCNTTAVVAGLQDNGTILFNGGRQWTTLSSADVGDVHLLSNSKALVEWFEPRPSTIATTGFNFLTLNQSAMVPATDNLEYGFQAAQPPGSVASSPDGHGKVMMPPLVRHPVNGKFYLGTDKVYEGDAKGATFTAISDRLIGSFGACSRPGSDPRGTCATNQVCVDGQCRSYFTDIEKIDGLSALGVPNTDSTQRIYAGTYSGAFWVFDGSSWQQNDPPTRRNCDAATLGTLRPIDSAALSSTPRCAPITSIDVDPTNPERALVTVGGRDNPNNHVLVFVRGSGWSSLSDGQLAADPDLPAMVVRMDPRNPAHAFLGTHRGLYERTVTSAGWVKVTEVPTATPVYDVEFDTTRGRVYAATHGRGVYLFVEDPQIQMFEGWMAPSMCATNKPCIWDILIFGQGFQPANGQACTVEILTPSGQVCTSGTIDPFSQTTIHVLPDGSLGAQGQLVAQEAQGKAVIAACFNESCVGPNNISVCEPTAADPNRRISAISVLCPGNNRVVASVGALCPELVGAPSTSWDADPIVDSQSSSAASGQAVAPLAAQQLASFSLSAALVGGNMEVLCTVSVPWFSDDTRETLTARARDAFNASAACQARGVTAIGQSGEARAEDYTGDIVSVRLVAPTAKGRALVISSVLEPGAAGICQTFANFPGYATSQLDILENTFSTLPTGAEGGEISFTEVSALGNCTVKVPTLPGENAQAIAQKIFDAYRAAYVSNDNPTCPYVANPGDVILKDGRLISIAATAHTVCINDGGVGLTFKPDSFPLVDATFEDLALYAAGNLTIKDRAVVRVGTGPGVSANRGPGLTEVFPDSQLRDLISAPSTTLRDRVHVFGKVKTGGTLTLQNGVLIDGGATQNASVLLPDLASFLITIPPAALGDVILEPDRQRSLVPGSYGRLHVKSRSTVTLPAGIYYFTDFFLEPQAKLVADNSGGAVLIYVRRDFTHRGTISTPNGQHPRLRVVHQGTSTGLVEARWLGLLVAPNSRLVLSPLNGAVHKGAFFAKHLQIEAGVIVEHVPFVP